jgi:hypothetical protein
MFYSRGWICSHLFFDRRQSDFGQGRQLRGPFFWGFSPYLSNMRSPAATIACGGMPRPPTASLAPDTAVAFSVIHASTPAKPMPLLEPTILPAQPLTWSVMVESVDRFSRRQFSPFSFEPVRKPRRQMNARPRSQPPSQRDSKPGTQEAAGFPRSRRLFAFPAVSQALACSCSGRPTAGARKTAGRTSTRPIPNGRRSRPAFRQ